MPSSRAPQPEFKARAALESRVIDAVARELAERATGMPAYLVDDETFAGWYRDAAERVERTPEPTLSPLTQQIEKAQHGSLGVSSRIFCDWVNAALGGKR